MYYVHKDHLGSLDKVTNSAGTVIQRTSFDACSVKHDFCEERAKTDVELIPAEERSREGRRRNPTNWTYASIPSTMFSRGYTGHEHLDQFDLINMNGRMYDPILGRFLSVDKYVQNPYNSQSYNRYSYVSNNPLRFTDPSGWQLAPIDQYWNLGKAPGNFGNFFGSPLQDRKASPYILGSDGIYYNKAGFIVSAQEVLMNYILPNLMGGLTLEISSTTKTTVITISGNGDLIGPRTMRVNPNGKDVYTWTLTTRHTDVATSVGAQSGGAPMIKSSFGANAINGGATLIDVAVLINNLTPTSILPRSSFDNVLASAAAGKLIAKGNVLLTWTAVTADGIDIYNNRAIVTNADYAKWGVDIGLATVGTGFVIASFIPGVNVAVWTGVALFGVSTANTWGLFDPAYRLLNK